MQMSTVPNCLIAWSNIDWTASSELTSACTATATHPAALISATTAFAVSGPTT
jgi:hypothetical protein